MAEIIRKNIDNHTVIAVWEITEPTGDLLKRLSLKPQEQMQYDSFLAAERKKQWLACRILIRSLLHPEDFPVEYNHPGKPFLAGSHHHISVTHSHDRAAVIISSIFRTGIDIEQVRPRILKVRDKFLSQQELASMNDPDDLEMLTLAWCAKEALYKLYGLKNLDFKKNIKVLFPITAYPFKFKAFIQQGDTNKEYHLHGELLDDFILVYVTDRMI
ncbi:MAG: 4'-phosphopantetheinyl transferase superfamily protein [Bacteroidales bacterium]|nr:4'-phosphopantetheinyl transferase superfamily protein [Bacteroidales bacterium]